MRGAAMSKSGKRTQAKKATINIALGPRKKRHAPRKRKTTHKKRAIWFQSQAAWPRKEARIHQLVSERARAAAQLRAQPCPSDWELVGPTNIGGRMTCAVCLPDKPETIWAGAAGGGVWKSVDGGASWRALWHKEATLNIGSLALDPNNPAILYCGTGEANLSADSYAGVGIYRSLDGGETWQLFVPALAAKIPGRIGTIAVDPWDSNHIRIGGVKHDSADVDGMFVSRNGGASWVRETFPSDGAYRCHTILFHPTKRNVLFATISARSSSNGIWRSGNGGATWKQLPMESLTGDKMGRSSLAIAPSNPSVMYAFVEDDSDGVLGVFKTANGGQEWENVAGDHFRKEEQIAYGNTIVVHPTRPELVICGGTELHRTLDGGKTWRRITNGYPNNRKSATNYAHPDHHCLLMPAARPGLVYDLNDGGVDVSENSGRTWRNRSEDLSVTMFYDVDVSQSDGRMFGGGTQDNGSVVTTTGEIDKFKEVNGGDGGWMLINPDNPEHFYSTVYEMEIERHRHTRVKKVSPPASKAEREAVWNVYLEMDPKDPSTIFAGGKRVWRTRNDGDDWDAVSDTLDDSPITAIEIARDSKTIYVGTTNGGVFHSLDGGDEWSGDLSGPMPGFELTRLHSAPDDPHIVYATTGNFGASHVFRSNDAGRTWLDIDRNRLPDVPHKAIAIPRKKPTTIYVCSHAGVYVSPDAGRTWRNLTRNLPNVPIIDLVYHEKDDTLTAATYGRSLWRLNVNLRGD
jgi:photosystem II stability/assembly factor-like uncharacterized protein